MPSSTSKSSMRNWNPEAVMRDLSQAWRLFWDPKVPAALKLLLPIAALVYWVFPLDLIPGIPLDDIAILILALRLFVQMASPRPTDQPNQSSSRQSTYTPADDANTIETTWRVVDKKG